MKVLSKRDLIDGLVDHPPYDTNPDLKAKLNVFYRSPDGRMVMAYYESAAGAFDVEVTDFDEIDYVLEGEVELISEDERLIAGPGDCFWIEDGDKFRWQMNKPSKMIFFLHSLSEEVQEFFDQLMPDANADD